jgi:hypothetical protein
MNRTNLAFEKRKRVIRKRIIEKIQEKEKDKR